MSSWALSWWQLHLLSQSLCLSTSRQPSRTCSSSSSSTRKSRGLRKPERHARLGQWSGVMSVMLRSPSARCMVHICVTYKIHLMGQRDDSVGKGAYCHAWWPSVFKPSRLTESTHATNCLPTSAYVLCCALPTHMLTPHLHTCPPHTYTHAHPTSTHMPTPHLHTCPPHITIKLKTFAS